MRLKNKVAIVTGGSRGIGRAVSLGFAREGARLVIAAVDDEPVRQAAVVEIAALGGQATHLYCDVSQPADVDRMVAATLARFGTIDILVNNAGICPFHDFLTMPLDLWQRVQDVNYKGTFLCSQAVARVMVERGIRGRIIVTSSLGAFVGAETQSHYCPTKAAVYSLMKCIAIPLGRYGITCNAVMPGAIETDINREELADPARRALMKQRAPIGRVGRPEDLVSAYVYFASDDSAFTTGSHILVDGGVYIQL